MSTKKRDTALIEVRGLTTVFHAENGAWPAVQDVSFVLRPGEVLGLVGESGSGKSVTGFSLVGLIDPPGEIVAGEIRYGGEDLRTLAPERLRALRGDRIAMIFQDPLMTLNPVLTIGTQLSEAIRSHDPGANAQALALAALKSVRLSQPEARMRQYPHELSGGMRQRVMIAMALALKPEVLIADEPTTALDVTVQREVLDLLRDLQRDTGTAIILITHDMGVVAEMADRVVVMKSGCMVETGPVRDIFARPAEAYTQALLAAVPRMGDGSGPVPAPAETIARIEDISVRYDIRGGLLGRVTHRVHAVEEVSFEIRMGETFSLVGESGCGKSTIARAMTGLVPHQGLINLAGHVVPEDGLSAGPALRRDVQMVFQDPAAALNPRKRVGDLVAEPLVIHRIGDAASRRERVRALFDRVGLSPDQIDRYPHEFSGGQRQRICIARALALEPRLIIADESVSALDVSVQARVLDLLAELKADLGISYLFISHDMAVVENISDRIAVMYLGQIVETGSRAQIFGNPQHPYTRRLIEAVPIPDPTHQRPALSRMSDDVRSPVWPVGAGPAKVALSDIGGGHRVASA